MSSTIIIAEAGVNHNGDISMAKRLIDVAADAGVDYVKFQTFRTECLVSQSAALAQYQKHNTGGSVDSQYQMLKKLELSADAHRLLIDYCRERGVKFLSTAFDLESIEYLASLHLDFWKVPSGEITDFPYLRAIARQAVSGSQKVILSTGMSTLDEVNEAMDVLVNHGVAKADIIVLHCNTQYPTPFADVNLRAMPAMGHALGVDVGYSDHTLGIEVPVAAVALGAKIIEKHFTLDRALAGPDHAASLEPAELKTMTAAIRNVEAALGSPRKGVTASECINIDAARKSIVAKHFIRKGEAFTEGNLSTKRPASGVSPMRWLDVIGRKASRDYQPDAPIDEAL